MVLYLRIKVSSWRFYNRQEEVINQKSPKVIDRFVFNYLGVDNAGQTADNKHTGSMIFPFFSLASRVEGDRGADPGRTGGGRGIGDGRRKGGKRDLYDGGKRERNSKRQAFVNCYCSSSSQRNEPNNVS